MKMPRSQCETGNIQFVQELAEVDGPFEAPININFRDLTKLELPSLVWNRSDACPRKMKITNTGHTVIVSGKWKCERPYLTGGPLLGKYVFSQIHFHWGHSDCRGSEHQICGEEFPLEMHVAHFKTEYLTQESALREKDGMVVVVYLFKLQDEPNHSLKKIINSLPRVKQPSTSHPIDPRPILSLCNPFTDDYFMYWGSVVTSTCAHILLWIICREPFGISREQVNEFRKIMDTCQQPICKNSRDIQPLHKRNVFHVNASKHLDEPLLPIKKMAGCYCKESKDAFSADNMDNCHCKGAFQNQEDVEGINVNFGIDKPTSDIEGIQTAHGCFGYRNFFVQTATVESLTLAFKRPGSDPVRNQSSHNKLKKVKSEAYCHKAQVNFMTKSCCFFPKFESKKIKPLTEKRKTREKNKLIDSSKAFTQIMHSLEALKNHTFRKLKKIESINQEIKEMKSFCQDNEDKRWVRKIEKMLTRQRRLTLKSSHGCFSELKKLAKECNFDKYVDPKALPAGDNDRKMVWISNSVMATEQLPVYDTIVENDAIPEIENKSLKQLDGGKTIKFSSDAQNLIGSFFEDIKDTEDLDEVKNDPNFQKIKSVCSIKEDTKSVIAKNKGYITQKMFNLGNLGDRFFTEVSTEDMDFDENWDEAQIEELMTAREVDSKTVTECVENEKPSEVKTNEIAVGNSDMIPLHRANITVLLPKAEEEEEEKENSETLVRQDASSRSEKSKKLSGKKTTYIKKPSNDNEKETTDETFMRTNDIKTVSLDSKSSSSILSTESTGNQRKKTKSRKSLSGQKKQKSSVEFKTSSRKLINKISCKMLEANNKHKKNQKNKKRKKHKSEGYKNLSSTSKEEENPVVKKPKRKKGTKAQQKPQTEKNKVTTEDFTNENALISPERKKLKLERNKLNVKSPKENVVIVANNNVFLTATETRTLITSPSLRHQIIESAKKKQESFKEEETIQKHLKESSSGELPHKVFESIKHESKAKSKTHSHKTHRASSADSKTSHPKIKEFEENQFDSRLKNAPVGREVTKMFEGKPLSKGSCRSLTDISATPKPDFPQRLHVESLDNRKKMDKNAFILKINLENTRKLKDGHIIIKELPQEVSKEINKTEEQECKETNIDLETPEKTELKTQKKVELKIELSTENSYRKNEEFLPKVQILDGKNKETALKRCGPGKYQFLEKEPKKPSEEHVEILRLTDSEKSFAKNASKAEENFLVVDNKNFQTSISCSTLKMNSTSRPHSAETLQSLKKTQKRKSKKRPHCSKKNSRHYIKKNYNVHGKPSKPFNFLTLTDEEQLKIISLNVANYLKQKLMDEKILPEAEKNTSNNVEKELTTTTSVIEEKPKEKPKEIPAKRPSADRVNRLKTKKLRIPVLKSTLRSKEKEKSIDKDEDKDKDKDKDREPSKDKELSKEKELSKDKELSKEKEKEKIQTSVKKPNTADSQPEAIRPKLVPPSSPKPVNNFIKINKQKAGLYKRPTTPANLPQLDSKEKAKSNLEAKPTSEIPRIKTKIPKKTNEKFPVQKPREELLSRPPTPLSPISQIPSPKGVIRKERQIRSSAIRKKQISNIKTTINEPPNVEKPKEETDVKSKPETEKPPSSPAEPKELPPAKKSLIPTCSFKINLGGPQKPENSKNVQEEVLKEDPKDNAEEDNKSEVLFKKELEYFITMQMYLNKEISKDIGNPLNYFNSKPLNSELNTKENTTINESIQNLNFSNKDIVVVQKKNLEDCPSSCSELNEYQITSEKDSTFEKPEDIPKSILTVKTPTDISDSIPIKAIPVREGSEDSPSDSSYDCKISITLNTNQNEIEPEKQAYDTYGLEENFNTQTTTSVEGSTSQITEIKPENEKSKDSDISLEVKKKLLEILEGEIKRKIGMSCGVSSGNSSEGIPSKMEDSEGNLRSQSIESSSSDNISLVQVSSSIKQYLSYLREIKRLPTDESKDYEEF